MGRDTTRGQSGALCLDLRQYGYSILVLKIVPMRKLRVSEELTPLVLKKKAVHCEDAVEPKLFLLLIWLFCHLIHKRCAVIGSL